MRMITAWLAFPLLMLQAAGAHGALRVVEQSYELLLSGVSWPATAGGSLTVRRCGGCAPEILRVHAGTEYRVRNDKAAVTLAEIRARAARLGGRRAAVYVYFDPKTRVVQRLVLDPAP